MIVNLINESGAKIQLKILFSKTPPGKRRRKHGRELIDTTCQIVGRIPPSEDYDLELATGIAKQNSLDRYNKITGKKIALARAINEVYCLRSTGCSTEDSIVRRSMRQHIWNVFHATFRKWR